LPPRRSWGRCLCFISARGFPTRSPPETPSASRGARSVFDASPPSTRSTAHGQSAPPPFGMRPLTTPPLPPQEVAHAPACQGAIAGLCRLFAGHKTTPIYGAVLTSRHGRSHDRSQAGSSIQTPYVTLASHTVRPR